MPDPRIPVYLITGFLDSGKTTLLTDTLTPCSPTPWAWTTSTTESAPCF